MPFFPGKSVSGNHPASFSVWKISFWAAAAFFTALTVLASRYYGITWDEWETSNNGIRALKNILTWGRDQSLMQVNLAYLYTHFFSVMVSLVYGIVHSDLARMLQEGLLTERQINNYFNVSHMLNALFGMVTAIYTGLLAKKLCGWRAAFFALVMLLISPRFFGHAMNNSKDIPFAAAYIFSIYHLSFFLEALPKINYKAAAFSALGIGICLGTRLGGAILAVYAAGLSAGILFHLFFRRQASAREIFKTAGALTFMFTAAGLICLIFWPYARSHSPLEVMQAFMKMSDFTAWNYLVLFEGKMTMSVDLPWYYIPKWILISSPLFFLPGLILCAVFALLKKIPFAGRDLALLLTASVFPLAFIILRDSNVYDSWRHLLFIYPPLIIFCASGWNALINFMASRKSAWAACILLAGFAAEPVEWLVKNPRHAGVYFSPAAGGIKQSFTRYESDYWGNCLRESSEWLAAYHKENYGNFPFAWVWADGTVMQTYPYLKKELGGYYSPFGYPRDFLTEDPYVLYTFKELARDLPWNYAVLISRHRTPEELKNNWPPAGTIHTVKAGGVPVCAVVKNENFYINLAAARTQGSHA